MHKPRRCFQQQNVHDVPSYDSCIVQARLLARRCLEPEARQRIKPRGRIFSGAMPEKEFR